MGNDSGTVTQMSVYVAQVDSSSTYRKFQLAIYTDNNGNPSTLVAKSATGTLTANSWNNVAVNANLQASTAYWLMYNTNGRSGSVNNMKYNTGPANSGAWSTLKTSFGTWPTNFGPATKWNGVFSLYATYTLIQTDTEAPTVAITSPQDAQQVSGTITIAADAADNVAVAGVQFKLDGNNLGPEDTTSPYAISWDSSTSSNSQHRLTAVARDSSSNQTTSSEIVVNVNNSDPRSQVGEWSPLVNWPLVAVHGSLLPIGKILLWDAWEYGTTAAKIWDPQANTFTPANVSSQLFCSAHSSLSDGRILTTGGHNGGEIGIKDTNLFDPSTNSWLRLADMSYARWYPTQTTLGDGRVITFSGQKTSGDFADIPEIYNPTNNTWSQLSVSTSSIHDVDYPLNFLLPDGKIFAIGATHGVTGLLDVTSQTWTNLSAPPHRFGSSAMYQPGKILYVGGGNSGGSAAKVESYTIDMNQANSTWRQITYMAYPRYAHNLLILPTGKVMAVGGVNIVNKNSSSGSLIPEIWDPASETWTAMDQADDARGYHSIAMLLPDGRVLSAGGGRYGAAQNHFTAQIFSPPYLFNGPRPIIVQAPASTNYASTITVDTPDAANISKVSLIPLASVTHTIDMNQKFIELPFTQNPNQLLVETPNSTNIAPPGYYMLFIINSNGVPSVAKIINLNHPDTQTPIISNIVSTNITSTTATITWTTDEIADSQIEYGQDTNYGSATTLDTTLTTNHSQQVTNLDPNTSYHYRVKSKDTSSNLATSQDNTFTTSSSAQVIITFDDLGSQDQPLVDQYPAGVINWGSNASWWHSAPWRKFTTKSVTFNGLGISTATFSFITPKQLVKLDLFNGGTSQATTTLSCPGMPNKQITLSADQMFTGVATGWTGTCSQVTISSSNGWDTNYDNLVVE